MSWFTPRRRRAAAAAAGYGTAGAVAGATAGAAGASRRRGSYSPAPSPYASVTSPYGTSFKFSSTPFITHRQDMEVRTTIRTLPTWVLMAIPALAMHLRCLEATCRWPLHMAIQEPVPTQAVAVFPIALAAGAGLLAGYGGSHLLHHHHHWYGYSQDDMYNKQCTSGRDNFLSHFWDFYSSS